MSWNIFLFESARGEKPVEEFIYSLTHQTIAKITHHIDLLSRFGNLLGMPHSKKIGGELYELRIRGTQEVRIFYCFKKKNIYLLHAFRKQTNKTPQKELKTALERLDKI